jgi:hypothetical protein
MRNAFYVGVALASLAILLQPSARGQPGDGKVVQTVALETSKLDQPLAWMSEAKRNFSAVKDYSCTMVSQENVRGKLLEENIMQMKVKSQPFSVHMRWIAPAKFKEQEVAFVQGKNNNKMRVKSNVLGAKIVGFMSIDPNDPRVLEHSRHNILEAGIGNMIDRTLGTWETERKFGKTEVRIGESKYNQRDCYRIESIRSERRPEFYCFRSVIYLEKNSKLPIRMENYDWPRAGGSPDGDVLEIFSYVNLQFNTGLRDEEFNK